MLDAEIVKYLEYFGFALIDEKPFALIFRNVNFQSEHELFLIDEITEDYLKNWALTKIESQKKLNSRKKTL